MATTQTPWTINLRVNEVQQIVHQSVLQGVTEVFQLDILPEAVRNSPVSPANPKIVGTKYPDTGHNRRSLDISVEDTPEGPSAQIFSQSGYGGYLEVGTSRMPARPYIYPAFQKFIGKLGAIVAGKLKAFGG